MIKRAFTLLEIVLAIALVSITSAVVGFKMYRAVEVKRFRSEVEKVILRISLLRKQSLVSQRDCGAILYKKPDGRWLFEALVSEDISHFGRKFQLSPMKVTLGGKDVDQVIFECFSGGVVMPQDVVTFTIGSNSAAIDLKKIYRIEALEKNEGMPPL